jgi:hypothetical protein
LLEMIVVLQIDWNRHSKGSKNDTLKVWGVGGDVLTDT